MRPAGYQTARDPDCRTRGRLRHLATRVAATTGGGATPCGCLRALAGEPRHEEGVTSPPADLALEGPLPVTLTMWLAPMSSDAGPSTWHVPQSP